MSRRNNKIHARRLSVLAFSVFAGAAMWLSSEAGAHPQMLLGETPESLFSPRMRAAAYSLRWGAAEPQGQTPIDTLARECGRQPLNNDRLGLNGLRQRAVARFTGLQIILRGVPGVPLRSAPGYGLSPVSQAEIGFRISREGSGEDKLSTSICVGNDIRLSFQEPRRNPEAQKLKNPEPKTDETIDAGKKLYQRHCASCHGPNGKGDGGMALAGGTPSDLTDETWDYGSTDGEIFVVIRDGVTSDMLAYKDKLNEKQIWQIVHYLRSIGPKQSK